MTHFNTGRATTDFLSQLSSSKACGEDVQMLYTQQQAGRKEIALQTEMRKSARSLMAFYQLATLSDEVPAK
jgi:hypothetical protein